LFIDDLWFAIGEWRYPTSLISSHSPPMILVSGVPEGGAQSSTAPHRPTGSSQTISKNNPPSRCASGTLRVPCCATAWQAEYPANGSPILGSTRVDREVSNGV